MINKLTYYILVLSLCLCGCNNSNIIKANKIDSNTFEYSINDNKEFTLRSYKYESDKWILESENILKTDRWLIYNDLQYIGYGEYTMNGDYQIEYKLEKNSIIDSYKYLYNFNIEDNKEYVVFIGYYAINAKDNPVIIEDNVVFDNNYLNGKIKTAYCITINCS